MINQLRALFLIFSIILIGTACGANINTLLGQSPETDTNVTPDAARTRSLPQEYVIGPTTPGSGLEQLTSYRANLIVDFEGTRNGQPAAGHIESLTEVNRTADALHGYWYANSTSPEIPGGISEFFRVGNRVYVSKANGEKFSFDVDALAALKPGEVGLLELDQLIKLPITVTSPPHTETVGGVPTQRYSFTEANLPSAGLTFSSAQGDLWLAETGSYLMQYVISATVTMATPLPNAHIFDKGRLNLSYTLTDINTDFEITSPPNIDSTITPLAQFPRLEDARVTAIFPTLLEYTSATSPVSATLFYQTGLPPNGWTEQSAEIFEEKSRLVYQKENQTLTVIVASADGQGKIKVLLNLDTQPH